MMIKHLLLIVLVSLSTPVFSQSTIQIVINGERTLDQKVNTKLPLDKASHVPDKSSWDKVVILSAKNKKSFFTKWQNKHSQTQLTLIPVGNTVNIEVKQPHKSVEIKNVEKLLIVTTDYKPEPSSKDEPVTPPLTIHHNSKTFLVDHQKLKAHINKKKKHGWPANWVIQTTTKILPNSDVTLKCGADSTSLVVPLSRLKETFIKLNNSNQWRAVLTDATQKNKRQWQRCKNLSGIYIKNDK